MRADELKKVSQQGKNNKPEKEKVKPVNKQGKEQEGEKKPKRPPMKKTLLCEMTGKTQQKVYKKDSQFVGSTFYKIKIRNVENMTNNAPEIVYAFKETICNPEEVSNEKEMKAKEELWRFIERDEYLGGRYIVYCYYVPMGYGNFGYKLYDLLERPRDK